MFEMDVAATIEGDLDSVWTVWSDMAAYPHWDPREETMRLDGPFAAGTTGFSKQTGSRPGGPVTITQVEAPTRFVCETPLPGGRLVLDHLLTPAGEHRTRLVKRYEAWGPMSVAFRLFFARGIRAEMPGTFAALEREVARRRALA